MPRTPDPGASESIHYVLVASASQLTLPEPAKVRLGSAVQILNLQLKVAAIHEQVNVGDQAVTSVWPSKPTVRCRVARGNRLFRIR